jgi:hypothetical protein
MPAHVCIDCDSAGDGNCAACRGSGRVGGASLSGESDEGGDETPCPACEGSGLCPKCQGSGEIEVGGEA